MNGTAIGFSIVGSLGGLIAFIGAIVIVIRAVFSLTTATKENTTAIHSLSERMDAMTHDTINNSVRIARLEGRGNSSAIH